MNHLTKKSTEPQIKAFFEYVLKSKDNGEDFPVNLDNVWMLVYSRKDKAVRELKNNFLQDVDYQFLPTLGENSIGRPEDKYFLSVSCLEYFIARKERSVFDVYSKVFHESTKPRQLSKLEMLLQSVQLQVEQEKRINVLEDKVASILESAEQAKEDLFALPFSTSTDAIPELTLRDKIRMMVNKYAAKHTIPAIDVWNKVYQTLNFNYHINIKLMKKQRKAESWLEVAERAGHLDKIYVIASNLIKTA